MKIENIENKIIYKIISGSHLYGLNTPKSDVDVRGIFLLPNTDLITLNNYVEQVSDDTNDTTFYELNRYANLLLQNNPNILELLYAPKDKILINNNLFYNEFIKNRDTFLTTKCKETFGGYSISQIKKARGLNKKIVNPVDAERKTPIDFCYLTYNNGSISLRDWLNNQVSKSKRDQSNYGLQNINNMKDIYNLYYREDGIYAGIISKNETSNTVRLSSIPKGETPIGVIYFNLDGYSVYCKRYKEYWDWVNKRNENRYNDNVENGNNYDSKNMMHCVRLLNTAIDIAKYGTINVEAKNKELLFSIRYGKMKYDDIIKLVEDLRCEMEEAYNNTCLPESLNINKINERILNIRL